MDDRHFIFFLISVYQRSLAVSILQFGRSQPCALSGYRPSFIRGPLFLSSFIRGPALSSVGFPFRRSFRLSSSVVLLCHPWDSPSVVPFVFLHPWSALDAVASVG